MTSNEKKKKESRNRFFFYIKSCSFVLQTNIIGIAGEIVAENMCVQSQQCKVTLNN